MLTRGNPGPRVWGRAEGPELVFAKEEVGRPLFFSGNFWSLQILCLFGKVLMLSEQSGFTRDVLSA